MEDKTSHVLKKMSEKILASRDEDFFKHVIESILLKIDIFDYLIKKIFCSSKRL